MTSEVEVAVINAVYSRTSDITELERENVLKSKNSDMEASITPASNEISTFGNAALSDKTLSDDGRWTDTTGAREEVDNLDLTSERTEQVQDGLSESFADQPASLNIEECLLLFNLLMNEKRKALFARGAMSVQERSTASRDSSQKIKVHHRPADISKLQQSASLSKTSTPRTSLDGQSSPLKKLNFWDRLSPSKTAGDGLTQSKTDSACRSPRSSGYGKASRESFPSTVQNDTHIFTSKSLKIAAAAAAAAVASPAKEFDDISDSRQLITITTRLVKAVRATPTPAATVCSHRRWSTSSTVHSSDSLPPSPTRRATNRSFPSSSTSPAPSPFKSNEIKKSTVAVRKKDEIVKASVLPLRKRNETMRKSVDIETTSSRVGEADASASPSLPRSPSASSSSPTSITTMTTITLNNNLSDSSSSSNSSRNNESSGSIISSYRSGSEVSFHPDASSSSFCSCK